MNIKASTDHVGLIEVFVWSPNLPNPQDRHYEPGIPLSMKLILDFIWLFSAMARARY